jgi:SNF2 family DNA or RNA helicase
MRIEADLHGTRNDRIALVSPYTAKDMIRQVPGARWSKDDSAWSVPLSWSSCIALRDFFGSELVVHDDLTKWAWELKTKLLDPATMLRESLGTEIPGDPRLYEFQRAGVAFLVLVKRALLADEMGAGKTVQTILALRTLRGYGELTGPTLVVCPNTMKRTWAREIFSWDPDADFEVIGGTAEQRRRQIARGAEKDFMIINWESLRAHSRLAPYGSVALRKCAACGGTGTVKTAQCEVHAREFNGIDFGAVIADEAHRAKDPKSLQTRALWAASVGTDIRFALTGTPISNDPTELWPILHWVDDLEWPAKTAWVDWLVDYTYIVWGWTEVNGIKPDKDTQFHATIDPRMRRMTKELVLPFLPPIVPERRDVEMNKQQAKAYDELRTKMIADLDSGMLLAANPMVQVGRLMQMASSYGEIKIVQVPVRDKITGEIMKDPETGATITRPEERLFLTEPSSKLDAFMADLRDFGDDSLVLFAQSRQLIELLSARMAKSDITHGLITGAIHEETRNDNIDRFQKGDFQFMLATVGAGGTGITLTKARSEVFLQRDWSPVNMDQA